MATDRAESIKKAEKLLRQGKLDLAIAEYVRMVDEQPRDWNTRNTLGDLYVRASQLDKAVAQYQQIADHLFTEGFFPKAAALYKKILKIKPEEESVQLHLGEISAKQGLLADAKGYFLAVAARRKARGDHAGGDEIVVRLGSLDPSDFDARTLAARTLEQNGDAAAAAAMYRSMHADLLREEAAGPGGERAARGGPAESGRPRGRVPSWPGRPSRRTISRRAAEYLDRTIAGDDPALLMPLMETRAPRRPHGRRPRDPRAAAADRRRRSRGRIVELAWTLGPGSPEAAFVCIDSAVNAELAAGNFMDAAAILQEFVTRVSGQIDALLKLVEICGGRRARGHHVRGAGAPRRCLPGARPGCRRRASSPRISSRANRGSTRTSIGSGARSCCSAWPIPDTVIAERLSGQGPFVATDPFMAAESFTDPTSSCRRESVRLSRSAAGGTGTRAGTRTGRCGAGRGRRAGHPAASASAGARHPVEAATAAA